MAETTGISWANGTWNPWYGCRKVSQGCRFCYAERDMSKYGKDFHAVTRSTTTFDAPLKWAKQKKLSVGSRIFTCSWSDWFIEEADQWRDEAWSIIRNTPEFIYMILTKRPERIADHLPEDWGNGYRNVWLGTSAENQAQADRRIPILLDIPARIRFVSAEPLLGPIIFAGVCNDWLNDDNHIEWVISGGESGFTPRPLNPDWVRSIRNQCQQALVPFFHKQHGGNRKIDGEWGGNVLDGKAWHEFPGAPVEPFPKLEMLL